VVRIETILQSVSANIEKQLDNILGTACDSLCIVADLRQSPTPAVVNSRWLRRVVRRDFKRRDQFPQLHGVGMVQPALVLLHQLRRSLPLLPERAGVAGFLQDRRQQFLTLAEAGFGGAGLSDSDRTLQVCEVRNQGLLVHRQQSVLVRPIKTTALPFEPSEVVQRRWWTRFTANCEESLQRLEAPQ
jgi:hypothetical protein